MDPDRWTFGHDKFQRGRRDLLLEIPRRKGSSSRGGAPASAVGAASAAAPAADGGATAGGGGGGRDGRGGALPLDAKAVVELGNFGLRNELDLLKRDKDLLVRELMVTRQAELKLKSKCDGLEARVLKLESSSTQMQQFILHYFSQVLASVSTAPRKRKRLPPARDVADERGDAFVDDDALTVAAPMGPAGLDSSSTELLRNMMRQMMVSGGGGRGGGAAA